MGNWQLEVGRMMLYISFPVGIFHYFNNSESIEQWLINERRKHYYSERSVKSRAEMEEIIENFNKTNNIEKLNQLEKEYISMKAL